MRIFASLFLILMLTGCGGGFGGVASSLSSGSKSPSDAPTAALGKTLYEKNCVGCHGALVTTTKFNRSVTTLRMAITSEPSMKGLSFLTEKELSSIVLALNKSLPKGVAASFRPVVSNRFLLTSQLTEIFVADSAQDANDTAIKALIKKYVTDLPEGFGGNCTRNDPGCLPSGSYNTGGVLDLRQTAEPVPAIGAVRKGNLVQACEQILDIDKSVQTLLVKSGVATSDTPTKERILKVAEFMFADQKVEAATVDKLHTVATTAASKSMTNLDQWRFVILPLCQGSGMENL